MQSRTRPRVFRRLLEASDPPLRTWVLSRGTLTQLSHALEDVVLQHDLHGAVLTGFQESSHWLDQLERYRELAATRARSVTVFAAGLDADLADDGIVRVPLAEGTPLREEWFLVVLTDGLSFALLGEDLGDDVEEEPERRFETLLSMDPEIVRAVVEHVRDEVALFDTPMAARIVTALAACPPGPSEPRILDQVLGSVVAALETARLRELGLAQLQQTAVDELRELERVRTGFLRAVSHELRTPASVILGMAETLQRLGPHLSSLQRQRFGDSLLEHANRLRLLLDDLLDVDRLSRGVLSPLPSPIDAAAAVRATLAVATTSPRVVQTGVEELRVSVDRIHLERIVVNLVTNAEKYAPEGTITVDVDDDGAAGLLLRVSDAGPGIPRDERERVFEPFHRLDNAHPSPGTGIGLTLVAEFARLHGGSVEIEAAIGGGASILVHLPGGRRNPTAP